MTFCLKFWKCEILHQRVFETISEIYLINNLHTGFSQSNLVEGNILSNQTKFDVLSRGPRLWNRLLNQEQKIMADINDFKNTVKSSLFYLVNEIIYFWIWGRKIKDKNSAQKLRMKILYIVHYLTHTAWGVTLSPTDLFGKCEQICNLLRIWSYLLKETRGGI